jgi:hypothetical protein
MSKLSKQTDTAQHPKWCDPTFCHSDADETFHEAVWTGGGFKVVLMATKSSEPGGYSPSSIVLDEGRGDLSPTMAVDLIQSLTATVGAAYADEMDQRWRTRMRLSRLDGVARDVSAGTGASMLWV